MAVQYALQRPPTPPQLLALLVSLALSIALARPRAYSLKIARGDDGVLRRTGAWVTLGWWVAVIAARVALGVIIPRLLGADPTSSAAFSMSTMLFSLGISLVAQAHFLERRLRSTGLRTPRVAIA